MILPEMDVNMDLKDKISKKDPQHEILSLSLEYIEALSDSTNIYTDGSKCEHLTAAAFYVPDLKLGCKIKLPDNSSVYEAELVAIMEAWTITGSSSMATIVSRRSRRSIGCSGSGERARTSARRRSS